MARREQNIKLGGKEIHLPFKAKLALNRGSLRFFLVFAGIFLARPTVTSFILCYAILIPGALLHLWSKGCLDQNRILCTSGPYRWTRNPFYLANLLVDVALCVLIGNLWLSGAYVLLWILVYLRVMRREEDRLERQFGKLYQAYRASVPRLLPLRFPSGSLSPSPLFSWKNPNIVGGKSVARILRQLYTPLVILAVRALIIDRWAILEDDHAFDFSLVVFVVLLKVLDWALCRRSERTSRRFQGSPNLS